LVVVLETTAVATFFSLMGAAGTTAPVGSVTTPVTVPVPCAKTSPVPATKTQSSLLSEIFTSTPFLRRINRWGLNPGLGLSG
jgi:hypothetical protein